MSVDLSVIIPVFNEADNMSALLVPLINILCRCASNFEIIIIDDGSTDGTFQILKKIKQNDSRIKLIKFSRNFGQHSALSAGYKYADGNMILLMDGDLQCDPASIPVLLSEFSKGYDIVIGRRENRFEPFFTRRLPSIIFNFLIRCFSGLKINDIGSPYKVFSKKVMDEIKKFDTPHRFLPILKHYAISEVSINSLIRRKGRSKLTFLTLLDEAFNHITSFSLAPLRFISLFIFSFGIIFFIISLFTLAGAIAVNILFDSYAFLWKYFLLIGFVSFVFGSLFIFIGLMGEYVSRIYQEVQNKPSYSISEIVE